MNPLSPESQTVSDDCTICLLTFLPLTINSNHNMPPWYKRTLSSEEALGRANTHLENARNTKDRRRAQKLCDEASEALERMDITKSSNDRDRIMVAYREHGKMLEKLGLADEAQLNYNKADELRYN